MYRTCSVVFFDECDKVQSNLDATFLPAIKLIERGSNGFLDQVVTWTRTTKLRNSRNDLRQLTFGQFNHALQNADTLVDNICTQLQLSPDESEWLAEKFFTCSSLARDFVLEIAEAEGVDTESSTFILDKNPIYQELADFLLGDWKNSWLAEYAMRLKSENYQEQQETIAKIQTELTNKGWLKAIKDKWGFCSKFALFLKLVLFVSFFQQSIKTAYGLEQQVDGAEEIVFFNRIPRDFYGLIPGLASGLVCGFKLERQENQLTLWYFQALGQGRWLLENFSHVFADEGTQGAHALLLSGTSWAGQSPIYHLEWYVNSYEQVDFVYDAIKSIDTSSYWKERVAALTSRSPLEEIDESLISRSNVENFADTNRAILIAPIAAIGRGKNMLNKEGLSAFGGAYFLVRPHPAPDDLDYKFRLALWRERKAIAEEREGNFIDACDSWRSEGYGIFLKSLDTILQYSHKGLSKEVREGLIWSLMVLTWQAIARTIRGNQPTLIRFIDAAQVPSCSSAYGQKRRYC